jgi:hypothetical protein
MLRGSDDEGAESAVAALGRCDLQVASFVGDQNQLFASDSSMQLQ